MVGDAGHTYVGAFSRIVEETSLEVKFLESLDIYEKYFMTT